ncbi:MAG: flavin reductase family protein [Acidimicrobiia bacterium]|nr:MAG: flavin reductase family protein [Acidimicrobiia bacterium]
MTGEIHEDVHPFLTPEEGRDPVRRFRGRLTAPVTVITAGDATDRSGMTVSSIMVSEGEPGKLHFLAAPIADVCDAIDRTGRFVVHILGSEHRQLSEIFAERRPSPGGLFAAVAFEDGEWGPVLSDVGSRAYCSTATVVEQGYSLLYSADIDRVETESLDDPLVYFRGSYRQI